MELHNEGEHNLKLHRAQAVQWKVVWHANNGRKSACVWRMKVECNLVTVVVNEVKRSEKNGMSLLHSFDCRDKMKKAFNLYCFLYFRYYSVQQREFATLEKESAQKK